MDWELVILLHLSFLPPFHSSCYSFFIRRYRFSRLMITWGGLKHRSLRNCTLRFLLFRHLVLPCSSFVGTECTSSEDSCGDVSPHSPYYPVKIVERSVLSAGKSEGGSFVQRKYSFQRSWCSKEEMMNRIVFVLQLRGWDLSLQNALIIELDESNVTRILNDLFDGSSDAALVFYFFRWSQRHNVAKHGLQAICTMIHISVLGNMNHIAVNFLFDVVQRNVEGEECHDLLLNALREASKDRKTLETIHSMLVGCFVDLGMTEMALTLFNHMETLGSYPGLGVCCKLLKVFLRSKEFEVAWQVFEQMVRHWADASASIVSLFIHECCAQGCFAHACKLLFEMRKCNCKADVIVYTTVIDALFKKGILKEATSLFYKMIQVGISPDTVVITSVVHGYCKAGKLVEAMAILMVTGCVPDIFVYNSIISKSSNDGHMEEASRLFDEMYELGLFPDSCNYTTLIGGYCKALKIDKALMSFGKMLKRGLKPTVLIYTILIECYCKIFDLQGAEYLLRSMKREDVVPDVILYNVLINGCSKMGCLQKGFELLNTMRVDGISPDVATYNIFMHGLTKRGFLKESRAILEELIISGGVPDNFTFANIINWFLKQDRYQEAFLTWYHMIEAGKQPDVVTCSALLNGICKRKHIQVVDCLFHKMLQAGLVPDLVLYNTVIRGFCLEGDTQEAFGFLCMMVKDGIIPNDFTYRALVHCLQRKGVVNALEISVVMIQQILLKNGVVIDKTLYVTHYT